MTRTLVSAAVLLVAGTAVQPVFAQAQVPDTVLVAPPTGETETDRASILAALEEVEPGGTVLFAPGTYLVGEIIRVETPRITFLGHPDGTVLRGCELAAYEEMRRDVSRARDWSSRWAAYSRCGILELTGGRATVRNLTFEYTDRGLGLGCCLAEPAFRPSDGGYLIENNTFRNSRNAIRASLASADTTVIRRNHFINVYHAVSAAVSHFHVTDNDISVPEPEHVPGIGHPGFAIGIEPVPPGPGGTVTSTINVCEHNVIAGNRIEGHPDGIVLFARPGTTCRHNVIRDNSIAVRRVRLPASQPYVGPARITSEADSTVVGVPLALFYDPVSWVGDDSAPQGIFEGNLIEGNHITGAEGLGIVVLRASRNRIVNNTIMGVTVRDPYPGNTIGRSRPEEWVEANGSGIWLSPGSEDNEIVDNAFEDVAGAEVLLEGDSNRVILRGAADSVRDLGTGNEVTVADGAEGSDVASEERVAGAADTVHVAPPTGEQEADRASILAALDAVEPGGTILFAPGTYLVGEIIHVTVPGIKVLGHSEGTTLRGCHPTMVPLGGSLEEEDAAFFVGCNGLNLAGGHQTVRGLTFEYAAQALVLGGMECMEGRPCWPVLEPVETRGGYLVEGNTFRTSVNGIRTMGQWREAAVIRGNDFVDTFHAVVVHGSTVHVLDNDISAPDPARVPSWGYPGGALLLSSTDLDLELSLRCAGNIFARNRVEGHPTAIAIHILRSGTVCRDNVIRDNTIRVTRVRTEPTARGETASTDEEAWRFGVPISLVGSPEAFGLEPGSAEGAGGTGGLEGNLIEGNRILGAEGLGVEIFQASRNRIVGNTIRDVRRRDPFPGASVNAPDPERSGWREANGSGIWVSPGSDSNEIDGNTFEDVAGAAVFLEGDDNRVELRSTDDEVRDRGRANRVTRQRGTTSTSGEVAGTDSGGFDIETRRTPGRADTVHVAPPTGAKEADRTSILAALDEVEPGGTVQFAAGTYLIGDYVRLTDPRVTLQGHPDGTTIRGCDPDDFAEGELEVLVFSCNGFELAASHQTIRGLVFEHVWHGLYVGCCYPEDMEALQAGELPDPDQPGGHLIEDNRFRSAANGMRVLGPSDEPSVIRGNVFRNTFHAVQINSGTAHVLDNDIAVTDPGRVPPRGRPGNAIGVFPQPPVGRCGENVVAGNRIEGYADAILLNNYLPGTRCQGNVVADNTIVVGRVPIRGGRGWQGVRVGDESDSTVVGVPLAVADLSVPGEARPGGPSSPELPPGFEGDAIFGDHRIEGNRIVGAEGIGIGIRNSSGNRIADNVVTGVEERDPFPGNLTHSADPEPWRDANGSGIWISPRSEDNEIVDNTFKNVAGAEVFLEGDRNRVALRSATDSVRDLGSGNQVIVPEPASKTLESRFGPTGPDPWPSDVPPGDTVRYTGIVGGITGGERMMWREGPDIWAYSYDMGRSGSPRTERLELDGDALPVRLEVSGQKAPWDPWDERFERQGFLARWTTTVDEGEQPVEGPRFYAALHPAHDPGVLARALLRRPSRRLPLLPAGEARLEALGERTIERDGRTRTVRHYAVHGLDLKPAYVWLDEDGATFADEWMVREGWESVFPRLKDASRAALADHVRALADRLMPPPRDRPLAIRGARLFDPTTGAVHPGTTILIEGNRVAAVGEDGTVQVPDEADVIDAAGRTALPGLWDMHTHHGTGYFGFFRYRELDAPLHLAGGVTTARDLGSHIDELLSLRRRSESGEAVGPRLLAAGYIDGLGGSRTGLQVGTAEEARAAVDRFAELGYVQIKIYGEVPAELVPVVLEQARRHGLRVSGHVPRSLSAREAVEAGFDELQHVNMVVAGILGSLDELSVRWEDDWEGWAEAQIALQPGAEAVRDFIGLLAARDVALDPTLALMLASEVPPHYVAPVLDRFPPQARRRLLDRFTLPPPLAMERRDAYVSSWTGFVRAAHEAGVPILPGTDLMPGFGLHREFELYVDAGIPAPEVLTLATLGAARAMGMDDELGSIEPGKLADLILVDGDPTTNISDIRRVMTVIKDGRVYDPAAIYRALGIRPCCER